MQGDLRYNAHSILYRLFLLIPMVWISPLILHSNLQAFALPILYYKLVHGGVIGFSL